MISFLTSHTSFFCMIGIFIVGAFGSLLFRAHDRVANHIAGYCALVGSLWGMVFALASIATKSTLHSSFSSPISTLFSFSFSVDLLSAFFICTIALIGFFCSLYSIGYLRTLYGTQSVGILGFLFNILLASLVLVVSASHALWFLVAWEIMSISSYFLVLHKHTVQENRTAGFLYLVMTSVGTACILCAFLIAYAYTGSFSFETLRADAGAIPSVAKNILFILATIGFGIKAGILPLHIWLPSAHTVAPAHVSAFMSGVMIKMGVYMMMRMFLDILAPTPLWWGVLLVCIGALSSLFGVLYALTEQDIKKLLAYCSIENIGIVMLGIGSTMVFLSLGMQALALLAFVGALFHILNHAVCKSLLFLGAGSVVHATHTRNMEAYGGLIKRMPHTALFFLVGSLAISAFPPCSSFFSEWVILQALFAGIALASTSVKLVFVLATASLAFTGGLVLVCFVKVFGITFLARPRSKEAEHAKETDRLCMLAMGGLSCIALIVGLFSGFVVQVLERILSSLPLFQHTLSLVHTTSTQTISLGASTASVSGLYVGAILVGVCFAVYCGVRFGIARNQKVVVGETWDCGVDLTPRMEVSAIGFVRSIILVFKGVLRPSIQKDVVYHDSASRYIPLQKTVTLEVTDVYQRYFYRPIERGALFLAIVLKKIQHGNATMYILYIGVALLGALLFGI